MAGKEGGPSGPDQSNQVPKTRPGVSLLGKNGEETMCKVEQIMVGEISPSQAGPAFSRQSPFSPVEVEIDKESWEIFDSESSPPAGKPRRT